MAVKLTRGLVQKPGEGLLLRVPVVVTLGTPLRVELGVLLSDLVLLVLIDALGVVLAEGDSVADSDGSAPKLRVDVVLDVAVPLTE